MENEGKIKIYTENCSICDNEFDFTEEYYIIAGHDKCVLCPICFIKRTNSLVSDVRFFKIMTIVLSIAIFIILVKRW